MLLDRFSRLYPEVWIQVDDLRASRKDLGDWPDWCFLPVAGAYAIVASWGTIDRPEQLKVVGLLSALAAWRATQGIYRFDPSTFDALWKTPVTGEIPTEVLHHLPEWCVYIPTPDQTWNGVPLYGFFARLDHDAHNHLTELCFVVDILTPDGDRLFMMPIRLGSGGIAEGIDVMLREYAPHFLYSAGTSEYDAEILTRDVAPLVSLVLYLCSQGAEIKDGQGGRRVPARPQPVKTKKGMRIFPPDRPNQWEVGYRLGAALRRAFSERGPAEPTGTHARPRPHIRRAHWHSFWVGKWDEPEARVVVLKWLPPIPVNVQSVEDLTTTVREVSHE